MVVSSWEWVSLVGSSFSSISYVDCWKHLSWSIVLDNMIFGIWFHVAPPRPPAHMQPWPWFHICHDTLTMHVVCLDYDFMELHLPHLVSFLDITTAQLFAVSLRAHCSLSHYDPATTVSAVSLMAHCKTRGKNDSKDKMVCRLVHDDCNMLYTTSLHPSRLSLQYFFSSHILPLSLSPPSSYFLSLPF